jgi:hypothetical protein
MNPMINPKKCYSADDWDVESDCPNKVYGSLYDGWNWIPYCQKHFKARLHESGWKKSRIK